MKRVRNGVDFNATSINGAGCYRIVYCAGAGRKIHRWYASTFNEAKETYNRLRRVLREPLKCEEEQP